MKRREFLAGTGAAAAATLGGALPAAHADATLQASIEVTDVEWTRVDEESHGVEVDAASVWVRSQAAEPLEPVVFLWCRYNWMMQSWTITSGPRVIQPGEEATLHVEAPGDAAQLFPGQPAQVTVVDQGTERRVKQQFRPTEVTDRVVE